MLSKFSRGFRGFVANHGERVEWKRATLADRFSVHEFTLARSFSHCTKRKRDIRLSRSGSRPGRFVACTAPVTSAPSRKAEPCFGSQELSTFLAFGTSGHRLPRRCPWPPHGPAAD